MDRSDVITLVKETHQNNDYGVQTTETEKRQVFCQVNSVTRSEFFEAGRNGLNPEYVFTMFFGDYDDERLVEYRDKRYAIYRTYITRNDTIELYAERKGGTNGTEGYC